MSVAVITPFFKEPAGWLQKCVSSVARQTMSCTHVLVSDGGPPLGIELPRNVEIIQLPKPHRDYGNIARAIGSVSAIGQGFDAIAWLDADNWYEPTHIEVLWRLQERTRATVCTSARTLYSLDGELLGRCPEVDGQGFVDTNCFLLFRQAFSLVATWYMMPKEQTCVGDRIFWNTVLESKVPRAHMTEGTLCYRTAFACHYRLFDKIPPPDAKDNIVAPPTALVAEAKPESPKIVPSSTKQTISLCMIVRNEEHNLSDCLHSVRGLVDEIIVVDTGSTDQTRTLAQRFQAKVFDFPWVDNFSAARNESLKHASCDWIFWMDADDRLDSTNRDRFQRLRDQLPDGNYAFMMKQSSVPAQPHGSPLVVDHVRVFRRQPNVAWQYRLHEQILPALKEAGARIVITDLVIEHLGYRETGLRRQKLERNLRILLQEQQEQPEDAFVYFNLAGAYLDLGETEKSVPFLHRCVEKAPRGASFVPKAHVLLVNIHRLAKRLDDAFRCCQEARTLYPKNPELLYEEGLIHEARKEPSAAQRSFETILELPRGPQFVGIDEGLFGHLTRHHLAQTLREQRQLPAAEAQLRQVIEQSPSYAPGWLALIEVLLDQKRLADAEGLLVQAKTTTHAAAFGPVLAARLQLEAKNLAGAVDTLEGAVATFPGNQWVRLYLCDVMRRHEIDLDRQERHLRHILSLEPTHRQVQARLAEVIKKRTEAGAPK